MAARSPSFWLLIAVVVVTAIMVHPSFAALFTVPVDLVLLVALRWAARREGQLEERALRVPLKRGFA
ncbi:hypothetical protein [Methylobacterium sp. J-070]|uniref:hypothetical protein n=1 Tax=Methylobacterium sp. J-070 TaxID=2836650 RepID=UPI001FB9B1DF|nr:hypothetical protein [Methylobacterium sp. J-070]MCJ2051702.1 hypothetical protein [Methylobacterium sp. J-070]